MTPAKPRTTNILMRSLALQLFLNFKTMQGAGYLFALRGELRGADEARIRAAGSVINGHPVFSSIALGAILKRLGEPLNEDGVKEVIDWKRGLSTPLGSIGDSLIWERFKPSLLALLVAVMIFAGGKADVVWPWCAAGLLAVYNVSLWKFRSWGFHQGYLLGARVTELALHPALPLARKILRVLGISAATLTLTAAASQAAGLGLSAAVQFGVGFLLMLSAVFLRLSTLTVAFFAILGSFGIYFITSSTSLLP